jgi:coenzyme F420 biosynthesis associated uncharacterized protein
VSYRTGGTGPDGRRRGEDERPAAGARPAGGSRSRPGWRRDKILQAGFLVGAAAGAAATVLGRRAESSARRGLIDWRVAEKIAAGRVRRAPGALDDYELARAAPVYASAMSEVVPALSRVLEAELPGIVDRSGVVSRAEWVHANISTFAKIIGSVEGELLAQTVPAGSGLLKSSMAIANRMITTRQFGYLMSFIGQRVLGQYDLALISAEAEPGRLLFVDENIRRTAAMLDVPLNPFRTWIALHETTHAFEFEAHPWLRPYLAGRLERQIRSLSTGIAGMSGGDMPRRLGRILRGTGTGESWMEGLMSPDQRRDFREIQAIMSLIEGFGDYVMDEVGRDLVPEVEIISGRFHARREQRTGFERAMMRITGMDIKMEQYRKGEEFTRAVATASGPAGLRMLWQGPESLPTPEEIESPSEWIDRVVRGPGSRTIGGQT